MAWRVAKSLDKLLAQINAYAPKRSKASDGSIGDRAHSSRVSDHNPDRRGIVHARDFTHDPRGGFDAHAFVRRLAKAGDRRIKYLISNRQISNPSIRNGAWRPYSGSNPHTKHAHVSVVYSSLEDNTATWPGLGKGGGTPSPKPQPDKREDDMKRIHSGEYRKPQTIKAGQTARIRTNKNGDYTMGGTKRGQTLITDVGIDVTGLLGGEKLIVKRVIVDYNAKLKRSAIKDRGRYKEIVGTANGAYKRGGFTFVDGWCGYGPRGDEKPRYHLEVTNETDHDVTVQVVSFDTIGN